MALLEEEKAHTRDYDRINAKRRRLPMVLVERDYRFCSLEGIHSLADLFGGYRQLIVQHFMFDPEWDAGCPGCTSFVDALGDLSILEERDTRFVIVSRAPIEKLEAYRAERGWSIPWFSTVSSDFNVDFGVTLDPNDPKPEFNYRIHEPVDKLTEMPGFSVFFRIDDKVYHTYSTFARGGEALADSYRLLDITPFGRQEDFEDSPAGWPQKPTY
jgi:predicted dithiol-disulfide oxidoreductase (DUF899 family)